MGMDPATPVRNRDKLVGLRRWVLIPPLLVVPLGLLAGSIYALRRCARQGDYLPLTTERRQMMVVAHRQAVQTESEWA